MSKSNEINNVYLMDKKTLLLHKWFTMTCNEYPDKTAHHLQSDKSQFANPVGHNLKEGLAGILDELLGSMRVDAINAELEKIIKVKAVQDFSPGKAIIFMFMLKDIVKEEVQSVLGKEVKQEDLDAINKRIDDIILTAFDIYAECKGRIYQLRIDEMKKRCDILEKVALLNASPKQ